MRQTQSAQFPQCYTRHDEMCKALKCDVFSTPQSDQTTHVFPLTLPVENVQIGLLVLK